MCEWLRVSGESIYTGTYHMGPFEQVTTFTVCDLVKKQWFGKSKAESKDSRASKATHPVMVPIADLDRV